MTHPIIVLSIMPTEKLFMYAENQIPSTKTFLYFSCMTQNKPHFSA